MFLFLREIGCKREGDGTSVRETVTWEAQGNKTTLQLEIVDSE